MQWEFEPGHSAAECRCRHMMVTWVQGHFKKCAAPFDSIPFLLLIAQSAPPLMPGSCGLVNRIAMHISKVGISWIPSDTPRSCKF